MTARVGRAAAPGRICLAGESLDWMIGGPSVVATISLRTRVSAHLADTCQELTMLSGPPINACRAVPAAELSDLTGDRLDYVQAVAYLSGYSWPNPPAGALHLHSELPVGAGVSSSASATVAAAAALLTAAHGTSPSPDTVARIAYLAERTAGSGAGWMDFLAVAHGGVNLIEATDPPAVTLLAGRLHTPVVLIDTLTRRSTRTLLAAKRTRWQAHDPDLLAYVDSAQALVDKLADAVRASAPDNGEIGQLVTQALPVSGRIRGEAHRIRTRRLRVRPGATRPRRGCPVGAATTPRRGRGVGWHRPGRCRSHIRGSPIRGGQRRCLTWTR
jgi:mevalonate kinase